MPQRSGAPRQGYRARAACTITDHKSGQKENERGHMCKRPAGDKGGRGGAAAAAAVVGTPRIAYWEQDRITLTGLTGSPLVILHRPSYCVNTDQPTQAA